MAFGRNPVALASPLAFVNTLRRLPPLKAPPAPVVGSSKDTAAPDRTVVLIGHLDDWLTVCATPQIVDWAFFDYCEAQFGWRDLHLVRGHTEAAGYQQHGQNVPGAHCPSLPGGASARILQNCGVCNIRTR